MRAIVFVTVVLLFSLVGKADDSPRSSVTIPVSEYLELKRHNELAKVTSIEEVKLRGTFGKPLSIVFSGRCAGGLEPRDVLQASEHFSLSNCKGEALLDVQDETVRLVPLNRNFTLTCELKSKNWNEFELHVENAFSFTGEVAGAEVISETLDTDTRRIVLTPVQRVASSKNSGEITGVAKYRVSVEPEDVKFSYLFRMNNPSRGVRPYDVKWLNGEIVQKARGIASYDEKEDGIRFNLNPGDNEIVVNGRFQGTSFKPLIPSAQQNLLLESHPTLQLTIDAKGRRISLNDSDLAPKFNNARLYVFGKEGDFTWTTRKLEVLESTGFSVTSAHYQYYIPENGRPVVDATFLINNQGTPEITFDVPGTPTYLQVNGQAQILYKSSDGKLLVQLPSGTTSMNLQYRPERGAGMLLSGTKAELVKPNVAISNVSVALATPRKWKVVLGTSLLGAGSDFDGTSVLFGAALALLFYLLAHVFDFPSRARKGLVVAGAVLGFFATEMFFLFALLAVGLFIFRHRILIWNYVRLRPYRSLVVGSVLVIPATIALLVSANLIIGGAARNVSKGLSQYNNSVPMQSQDFKRKVARPTGDLDGNESDSSLGGVVSEPTASLAESGGGGGAGAFQGLPARIEVPYDLSFTNFNQSMVDQNGRIVLRSLLLSNSLINVMNLLILLGTFFLFWKRRTAVSAWALQRSRT